MRHLVWLSGVLLALSCTVNGSNLNVDGGGSGVGGCPRCGGTGGDAATGGQPGAGGTSATGGATASGGQPGTGGDGQAGGTTGAGGSVTGTGGSGTGGSSGKGGSGAGGSSGKGGSGAGGGATGAGGSGTGGGKGGEGGQGGNASCDKLASDYASAMTAAKACTPGATNQCQTLVDGTIGCSGCRQYVNDSTTLDQLQNQWDSQGCSQVCSAIACVTPPSTCAGSGPTTGGPGGGANPSGTCTGGLVTAAR